MLSYERHSQSAVGKGQTVDAQAPPRRYYLDWLRVLAIFLIFVYHCTRPFDTEDWHVKNAVTYGWLGSAADLLAVWGMPLVFVISGASTFFSVGKLPPLVFLRERALRLLVPLVVGIYTHAAFQVYLERLTHGEFSGSFADFYPHYFDGFKEFGGNFAWHGMHLWYLEMLFVFSLLFLPLLAWLRRGGAGLLDRLAAAVARPGGVYLLAAPLVLALVTLDPTRAWWSAPAWAGWSIVLLALFFLLGFVLPAREDVQQSVRRLRWLSLGLAAVMPFIVVPLLGTVGEPQYGTPYYAGMITLLGLFSWCCILAAFGFTMQRLSFGSTFLWLANEAVLPIYVLHQTVILSLAFFLVQWPIHDLLKFVVLLVGSFAASVAIYWFLIRPFNVMRVLFGMKPRPRTAPAVRPTPTPA